MHGISKLYTYFTNHPDKNKVILSSNLRIVKVDGYAESLPILVQSTLSRGRSLFN